MPNTTLCASVVCSEYKTLQTEICSVTLWEWERWRDDPYRRLEEFIYFFISLWMSIYVLAPSERFSPCRPLHVSSMIVTCWIAGHYAIFGRWQAMSEWTSSTLVVGSQLLTTVCSMQIVLVSLDKEERARPTELTSSIQVGWRLHCNQSVSMRMTQRQKQVSF